MVHRPLYVVVNQCVKRKENKIPCALVPNDIKGLCEIPLRNRRPHTGLTSPGATSPQNPGGDAA